MREVACVMNRLSLTLMMVGFLSFTSVALSQTAQSPVIAKPCAGDELPGRPTLKVRRPADEKLLPAKSDETGTREEPCDTIRNEADSALDQKLAKIRFEGLTSISESDLRKLLREKPVAVSTEPSLEPELVKKAEQLIRECLVARGFRHAVVSSRMEKVGDGQNLTFVVSEGPRLKIAEIRFEGSRIFSSQVLAAKMNEYLARYDKANEGYDADIFDYCLHSLNNFVRGQGYLQASFRDPKVEESNGGLIVTLVGNEGALYRLGKLAVDGSSLLSAERIVAMLGQSSGDIANGERISKFLYEELKAYYGERGYIQYTAEVTPEFNLRRGKSEGVVDLAISIDEGRRFRIFNIDFQGADLPSEELRQLIPLHKGDVYNQRLFEESIHKLNDTGLFEQIDKDKDADFRTNEEEGFVDIVVKLTKRPGQLALQRPDSVAVLSHATNLRP
jgi:outer membrane protein assembly factor BamA